MTLTWKVSTKNPLMQLVGMYGQCTSFRSLSISLQHNLPAEDFKYFLGAIHRTPLATPIAQPRTSTMFSQLVLQASCFIKLVSNHALCVQTNTVFNSFDRKTNMHRCNIANYNQVSL